MLCTVHKRNSKHSKKVLEKANKNFKFVINKFNQKVKGENYNFKINLPKKKEYGAQKQIQRYMIT